MNFARVLAVLLASAAVLPGADYRDEMQSALEAFSKGDFKSARDVFAKLAGEHPEDAVLLLNLGTVEFRLNNYDAAAEALSKSVRIDAENAAAWLALGIVRIEQNHDDGALAALSQAVFLEPKNARAHAYLGVAVGRRGWLFGAEKELRAALEIEPGYADAHFNLALFYLQRTPPAVELARRHYQRALDLGAAPDAEVEKQVAVPEEKSR